MSLCTQCRKVDLQSLQNPGGQLLHDDWRSLSRSALECDFCKLIWHHLEKSIQNQSDGKYPFATRSKDVTRLLHSGKKTAIWLECRRAVRSNDPRKPLSFSYMSIGCGEPRQGNSKSITYWGADFKIFVYPGYDPLTIDSLFQLRIPLAANPLDPRVVEKVRMWIKDCRGNHTECQSNETKQTRLPTRLLSLRDVQASGTLTIEKLTPDFYQDYVTLSYCWGKAPVQEWIDYITAAQARDKAIKYSKMPKTLSDTVTMTLSLGYQYLWIDCLCITQRDKKEWLYESAKMSDIYEGSALTISASDTEMCWDGMISDRDLIQREGKVLKVLVQNGHTGNLHIVTDDEDFGKLASNGPVALRAWCLQERRLASRVLHVCKGQVYFECAANRHFEYEARPNDIFVIREKDLFHMPRVNEYPSNVVARGKPSGDVLNVLQWCSTVEEYTRANLTMPEDKLVAISGLAERAKRKFQCEYLAGLWTYQIHTGLAWRVAEGVVSQRCPFYRAPSWSWASVDGAVSWEIDGWVQSEDGFLEPAMTLVDADIEYEDSAHLGTVISGSLTLTAPLRTISSSILLANDILTYPRWMSRTTPYVGYYIEDEQKTLTGELLCLKIAVRPFGSGPSIPPTNVILVLGHKERDTCKRLGYGLILQTDFFDNVPIKTVHLV